jgi:hypothetical protein
MLGFKYFLARCGYLRRGQRSAHQQHGKHKPHDEISCLSRNRDESNGRALKAETSSGVRAAHFRGLLSRAGWLRTILGDRCPWRVFGADDQLQLLDSGSEELTTGNLFRDGA